MSLMGGRFTALRSSGSEGSHSIVKITSFCEEIQPKVDGTLRRSMLNFLTEILSSVVVMRCFRRDDCAPSWLNSVKMVVATLLSKFLEKIVKGNPRR